jgi:hypothetical protein
MSDLDELFRRDPLKLTRELDLTEIADFWKKRRQSMLGKKKVSDTELSNLQLDLWSDNPTQ